MKKILSTLFVVSILVVSLSVFVMAVKPNGPSAANGLSHPGKVSQLYLYEKDVDWNAIEGGAWGKLKFDSDSFVFNGHGLESGMDYSLIYYPDYIGSYNLDFLCTSGCSGTYTHTLMIGDLSSSGFTGTGHYNANTSYTWDVDGTSSDTFSLVYTGIGAGYTLVCTAGSCSSGSGQEFDLTVTSLSSAWPHQVEVIGEGIANDEGNVHMSEDFDFSSVPWDLDLNSGAKIWLVKSSDLVDSKLSGWNPSEYLFEYATI